MENYNHPTYGQCLKLTQQKDIQFTKIAQGALVNKTTLPFGTVTPSKDMRIL
jgi:hypothetical protein